MTNKEIARAFQLLGGLMELHGENPFKVRSYQNAFITLRKLEKPLSEMPVEDIAAIQGLGKAIVGKIEELLKTGEMQKLNEYLAITPEGVSALLSIKGLGPKKIRQIWKEMGIENPGELLYACEENRLVEIKGFGLKTQEDIKKKIRYWLESREKFLYAQAEEIADQILMVLSPLAAPQTLTAVGEYRRKCPIINSLEFLMEGKADATKLESLNEIQVRSWGEDKAALQFREEIDFILHFSDPGAYPVRLFTLTGPSSFVGRYSTDLEANAPEVNAEIDVFKALDVPFILPELRDAEDPEELARRASENGVVTLENIHGVLHNHSTYSDGLHTLADISAYVKMQGYSYFGISDHSQSAFYAHGLEPGRVKMQFDEIDSLNKNLAPFWIFKGIESDILNDGSLDYEDDLLRQFDFIVASIHSNLRMDKEKATKRLITAVENPYTRILGHPTSRLLLAREGYPIDHKKVIDACAANKVVIELNANPLRLDIDYSWIPYCLEKGVMIAINPDAHSKEAIHQMKFGVYVARKAALPVSMCLNCLPLDKFEEWLASK